MIADRYTRALFHLEKDPEEWLKELEGLTAIFNAKLMAYFTSPLVGWKEKEALLTKALKDKLDNPKLLHFLRLLLKKKRFAYLPEIVERFKSMVYKKLGMVEGVLVVPSPIDEETKKQMADKWEKLLGKKILLQEKMDKSLIGGGVFMFDHQRIDFSLKGKLERLQKSLRET